MAGFEVVYFGASCDSIEKNKQFAEKLDLNFPLLSDTDRKAAAAYGILNAKGTRSSRATIYVDVEGRIAHIQSKVNVRDHGMEVVEQLKKLDFPLKAKPGVDQ